MGSGGCMPRAHLRFSRPWWSIAGKTAARTTVWALPSAQNWPCRGAQPRPAQAAELFRLSQNRMAQGWDVLLVARGRTARCPHSMLQRDYDRALAQLGLVQEDKP